MKPQNLIFVSTFITVYFVNGARLNNYYKPVGHVRTDPILSNTCLSDHVHTFYGPQALRPETTTDDILSLDPFRHSGNTEENMSLYWHPTIYHYDPDSNLYTREDIMYLAAYYFWDQRNDLVAFPKDFKMIQHATADIPGEFQGVKECIDDEGELKTGNEFDCTDGSDCYTESSFFPRASCRYFEFTMMFPICWDGRLDSDDHISHVAYTVDGKLDGDCPETHNVGRFPAISLFVSIENYKGGWYTFSDKSDVFHADYLAGWDPQFLQNILDNCNTNKLDNCDDFLTFKGDTKFADLYPRPVALEAVQPNQHYDTKTISPEEVDVVSELPRGTCTGTLLPPNDSPTNTPVSNPTVAPIVAPTGGACVDQPLAYKDRSKWDCDWVGKKTNQRCIKTWKNKQLSEYCPVTCDAECDNAPVPTPTVAPVPNPTMAPVAGPTGGACVDQPLAYKDRSKWNCDWVGEKIDKRCNKTWKNKQLSEYCPVACDAECNNAPVPTPTLAPVAAPTGDACVDQPLAYKDRSNWDCDWVGEKAGKRCNKVWKGMPLWEYCPVTCDECE